jgi:hypothetical protein
MIFKIADGREHFYQWDIDRQIIVSDSTIKEVHFCNRTDDCSLVVPVEDGIANVPNLILQSSYNVRVFGYDGKATLHEETFEVKARTRPADYVYTEEQEYTIEAYIERAVEEAKATGNFQGDTGPKGDKGDKGDTGEPFTYDMFTEEQLEALRGPEGKQGPVGPQGERGEKGTKGDKGDTGRTGETGPRGLQGPQGDRGERGYQGEKGEQGPRGFQGEKGDKGDRGEQGPKGDKGDTPDLTGYATESYVNDAIANIEIPESGEMNNVVIIKETVDDGDRIQSLIDEGKWPILYDRLQETYCPLLYFGNKEYYFGINIDGLEALYCYNSSQRSWSVVDNYYYNKAEVDALNKVVILQETQADGDRIASLLTAGKLPVFKSSYGCTIPYSHSRTVDNKLQYCFACTALGYYEIFYYDPSRRLWDRDEAIYYADFESMEDYVDQAIAAIEIPEGGGDADLSNYYTKTEVDELHAEMDTSFSSSIGDVYTYVDDAIANIDIPEGGDVDLSNYYTKDETYSKAEVDEAIAGAGGSGGGSGKTQINITWDDWNEETFRPETKTLLTELLAYAATGANPLDKYDINVQNGDESYTVTSFFKGSDSFTAYALSNTTVYRLVYSPKNYGYRVLGETGADLTPKFKDWWHVSLPDDLSYWTIGWCNELYLLLKITADGQEYYGHSYVVLSNSNYNDLLYNYTNKRFSFTVPTANMNAPYWYWDGEKIVVEANGNTCELVKCLVKGQYT